MSDIFVDTSGWGNLVDISQPYHQIATHIYRNATKQKRKLITTNYIVSELVALLSSPLHIPRPKIIAFIQSLKASSQIKIIHVDLNIDNLAWDLSDYLNLNKFFKILMFMLPSLTIKTH